MEIRVHRMARPSLALPVLALAGAIVAVTAAGALAGPSSKKMSRQIDLFERIVDQVLVDSPNWLVQSREETRGTYVKGHGAVFTFDASLVGGGWGGGLTKKFSKIFGGDHVIVLGDDDEDDDKDLGEMEDKWLERQVKRQGRYYERGKVEIVEMLGDFGDILTTLGDDEWIEIEVSLGDAAYFVDKDLDRLSVSVKMSDVRAFADEKIDEEAFVKRVQTQET